MQDSRGNKIYLGDELRSLLYPKKPGVKCAKIDHSDQIAEFSKMVGSWVDSEKIVIDQETLEDSHWVVYKEDK